MPSKRKDPLFAFELEMKRNLSEQLGCGVVKKTLKSPAPPGRNAPKQLEDFTQLYFSSSEKKARYEQDMWRERDFHCCIWYQHMDIRKDQQRLL